MRTRYSRGASCSLRAQWVRRESSMSCAQYTQGGIFRGGSVQQERFDESTGGIVMLQVRGRGVLALVLLWTVGLVGCDNADPADGAITTTIHEVGGEVVGPGGDVRLQFPPGAVTESVEVSIAVVSGSSLDKLATELYELSPSGIVFQVPVTFRITLGPGVPVEGLYLAKVVNGQPIEVAGSRVDAATRELSGSLTSFSQYGGFIRETDPDACVTCVNAKCPVELQACEDDEACAAILACVGTCLDEDASGADACTAQCVSQHPGGAAAFETMSACAGAACDACSEGGGTDPDPDACVTCVNAKCPVELQACEDDEACAAILACVGTCLDEDASGADACTAQCVSQHPGGAAAFETMSACAGAECDACSDGGGTDPDPDAPIAVPYDGGTLSLYPVDNMNGVIVQWGPENNLLGATSESDGASNTAIITSALGDNGSLVYAAQICSELDSLGYSDWYLPSKAELDAVYEHLLGSGEMDLYYWTSTEAGADFAWSRDFSTGEHHDNRKGLLSRVRCVRR